MRVVCVCLLYVLSICMCICVLPACSCALWMSIRMFAIRAVLVLHLGYMRGLRWQNQATTNQTTLVTQFWKRRLGPTKTNQTLTESRNWLAGATIKNTKPTITEEIINPPMHIRNSDVRKSSWAETHEQKASRQLRPDNLDHRISSHGVGGGIKADNKLSRIILWWVPVS